MSRFRSISLLVVSAVAAVGCGGGPPVVHGEATYDGEPIEDGIISFVSADGQGSPFGGKIRDGKYEITKANPGKKRVSITASVIPEIPPGSREPVFAVELIPPNAVGNNAEVEIVPGDQTQDFHLTPPE